MGRFQGDSLPSLGVLDRFLVLVKPITAIKPVVAFVPIAEHARAEQVRPELVQNRFTLSWSSDFGTDHHLVPDENGKGGAAENSAQIAESV